MFLSDMYNVTSWPDSFSTCGDVETDVSTQEVSLGLSGLVVELWDKPEQWEQNLYGHL